MQTGWVAIESAWEGGMRGLRPVDARNGRREKWKNERAGERAARSSFVHSSTRAPTRPSLFFPARQHTVSSTPPTAPTSGGPAESAGKREARSPEDAPLTQCPRGDEHPQRKGTVEMPSVEEATTPEARELLQEAQKVVEVPYEPHSTEAAPSVCVRVCLREKEREGSGPNRRCAAARARARAQQQQQVFPTHTPKRRPGPRAARSVRPSRAHARHSPRA